MTTSNFKDCAIAIFVKTPGLTPVKTRLAADIGVQKAEAFYKKSLHITQHQLNQLNEQVFAPHWAITEREGLNHRCWASFPTLFQGEGGLGQRLHRIYSLLIKQYNFVLLAGSDSPQIEADSYTQAHKDLCQYDFVMGPTDDGGFYLFGGRREVPKDIWLSTPYSTKTTSQRLIQQIEKKIGTLKTLPKLFDIDTIAELKKLVQLKPQFQDYL